MSLVSNQEAQASDGSDCRGVLDVSLVAHDDDSRRWAQAPAMQACGRVSVAILQRYDGHGRGPPKLNPPLHLSLPVCDQRGGAYNQRFGREGLLRGAIQVRVALLEDQLSANGRMQQRDGRQGRPRHCNRCLAAHPPPALGVTVGVACSTETPRPPTDAASARRGWWPPGRHVGPGSGCPLRLPETTGNSASPRSRRPNGTGGSRRPCSAARRGPVSSRLQLSREFYC
eukprot:scaffold1166_cov261-Pinguiococcus_pyrenoidosus.AAC.16